MLNNFVPFRPDWSKEEWERIYRASVGERDRLIQKQHKVISQLTKRRLDLEEQNKVLRETIREMKSVAKAYNQGMKKGAR